MPFCHACHLLKIVVLSHTWLLRCADDMMPFILLSVQFCRLYRLSTVWYQGHTSFWNILALLIDYSVVCLIWLIAGISTNKCNALTVSHMSTEQCFLTVQCLLLIFVVGYGSLAEQQQQQQQQVTFMQKLQAERRRRLLEYQQRKRLEVANGLCFKFCCILHLPSGTLTLVCWRPLFWTSL